MHYEHLVAVNDPTNPTLALLTRSQLWRGLMLRVESPQLFNPHIETVSILDRSDVLIVREMDFGNLLVRDHIHLHTEHEIHYDTQPGGQHLGGSLKLGIEEPEADFLLVRFTYDTPTPDDDPQAKELNAYLKEMWRQMDVDSIVKIRELAETGRLDGLALQ